MKKYFSLYKQILKINFAILMAYRANLVGHLVVTTVWTGLTIFTMLIITEKAKLVYGWTQSDMLLMTGGFTVLVGVFSFLFKRSFHQLPQTFFYGRLDNILLKPVDSQFLVSFLYIGPTSLLRSIVGIIFIMYVINKFAISVTFFSVVSFSLLLIAGLIIYYSIWMIAATLLVWFPRLSNVLDLVNSLNHTSRFPPDIFREFNIFLFLFLLPYMFILAAPVRVLIQESSVRDVMILLVSASMLFVISRTFWKFALRSYTSASG